MYEFAHLIQFSARWPINNWLGGNCNNAHSNLLAINSPIAFARSLTLQLKSNQREELGRKIVQSCACWPSPEMAKLRAISIEFQWQQVHTKAIQLARLQCTIGQLSRLWSSAKFAILNLDSQILIWFKRKLARVAIIGS